MQYTTFTLCLNTVQPFFRPKSGAGAFCGAVDLCHLGFVAMVDSSDRFGDSASDDELGCPPSPSKSIAGTGDTPKSSPTGKNDDVCDCIYCQKRLSDSEVATCRREHTAMACEEDRWVLSQRGIPKDICHLQKSEVEVEHFQCFRVLVV